MSASRRIDIHDSAADHARISERFTGRLKRDRTRPTSDDDEGDEIALARRAANGCGRLA